jgi:hypothetical protein
MQIEISYVSNEVSYDMLPAGSTFCISEKVFLSHWPSGFWKKDILFMKLDYEGQFCTLSPGLVTFNYTKDTKGYSASTVFSSFKGKVILMKQIGTAKFQNGNED